jgi:hypothetical protein
MTYNRSIDVGSMPARIRCLPVSPTGFPVPWFVVWFKEGKACNSGDGVPDFRVVDPSKMAMALKKHLCWVCGQPMGQFKCFVVGPMCAINRVISEPPSHRDCAIFSAEACPFLTKPNVKRNKRGLFDEAGDLRDGFKDPAGLHIARNPGAVCVWITKSYRPFRAQGGILFSLGPPIETLWFANGRQATRDEVMASIDSGYPTLEEIARLEGADALADLTSKRKVAMALVPS